jgi:hypothetical protein
MNEQGQMVNSILGKVNAITSLGKEAVRNTIENASSPETGSYIMKVVFYLLFYTFIIFIILTLVHFTITPVFRFTPESKGYIGVPGTSDSKVYWTGEVPAPLTSAPDPDDSIHAYKFENNFSFSVDLFVTKLSDTGANNRLVLFKTFDFDGSGRSKKSGVSEEQLKQLCGFSQTDTSVIPSGGPTNSDIQSYMAQASSMIMYLTETNDLVVTFFVGSNGTVYNSRPIRNIPLNTPFRVTVVVEEKLFTVYLNGKQTFQRIVSEGIRLNSINGLKTDSQRFYTAPTWADQPKKTIYAQNLILWPRAIRYGEVVNASPALATTASFNVPSDLAGASCS